MIPDINQYNLIFLDDKIDEYPVLHIDGYGLVMILIDPLIYAIEVRDETDWF